MPRPPFSFLDSPTDNVDGSWKGSVAGVGFIILNSRVSLICSQTKCLTPQTQEEMEAKVVLTGMELALLHNLEHVIEDDSKLVMDAINDRRIRGLGEFIPLLLLCIGLRVCFVQSLGSGLRDLPIEQPMLVQL
ncbi:hypothetical protein C1H46_037607 [Malus baccata]|uniref:RNase H type-1 domain-containing protein n=1 Tax=Malus baccata TaxID=106549 RepID=A0A540KRS3_MALBA|nr:hypothetical protein C1H46_037607 [Malus baccata]